MPTRLTATLADGQWVVREVDFAPGFPGRAMTRNEVARKLDGNVAGRWSRNRAGACIDALWAVDPAGDVPGRLI